jgi:hypothetical protein
MNTNHPLNETTFVSYISFLTVLLFFSTEVAAQCRGVKPPVATLVVSDRPCGPTATGSIALEIKGGKAPYTLSWTADEKVMDSLPTILNSSKLTVENLKPSMKPGYTVNIKDVCENITTASVQLIVSVPIHFVNAPVIAQQVTRKDEPNGKLRVELRGGNPPRSLVATDSKGKSFVQQFPVGPAEKGIFKYELNNLPAENYKIELKSGSEKCTQVWKETIEFKAPEK